MRKPKDVKFIIYQALYIFVVCVIALKGANLDLTQVVEDDGKIRAEITPDSLLKLQELLRKSIIVDTTLFAIVDKKLLLENQSLRELVMKTQQISSQVVSSPINTNVSNITEVNPKIKEQPEEKKDPGEMQEIRIGNIQLTQFTQNTLNNPYDVPLEVVGITTIPAKSSKTFETGGQNEVVIKVGSSSKTVSLKPNEKPKISMQRVATMGEDAKVSQLQRTVGFRVVITDDFPGQLEVKWTGPITVKDVGKNTYDITMNAFGSKVAYDNFTENKNTPFSVGFTLTIKDRIAGHVVTGQNSFIFGDW